MSSLLNFVFVIFVFRYFKRNSLIVFLFDRITVLCHRMFEAIGCCRIRLYTNYDDISESRYNAVIYVKVEVKSVLRIFSAHCL